MSKRNETISRFAGADVAFGAGISADEGFAQSAFPTVPPAKRLFDIIFAALAMVFFAPFVVGIVLLLALREGGPVFFSQTRIGHAGKPFSCLKFRTMVVDAEERLEALLKTDPVARAEWEMYRKLENDPRISCIGGFLRRSSLDELPQFFNVLRGDMSIVGPRPIIPDEVENYREHIAEYKSVRPGITGAWQVSGRNETTFDERVQLDVDYVRNQSLRRDVEIVFSTVHTVLSGRGAR